MVASVRSSIGVGIPYEIVLVDGGSSDGTLSWAKAQKDVVLIEQGELLGAIKAFNAGLYAAKGTYCVVGNDDIIYHDETLINAVAYMQDNPNVGVGCFLQDRDHPGRFDLSYMPVVMNGQQMQHVYGQVCIVPKWLGDMVGWWGNLDNMRTYGGDNNLSSWVLEQGYRVTGIPCACISDFQVDDELRRINNQVRIQQARQPGHPDSNAWGKHWTHPNGTCGPMVKTEPIIDNPIERMPRFVYLPIYEQGHAIQKTQKHGLRDALARYGLVYEYDWLQVTADHGGTYMVNYLMDIIDAFRPDVLLTQIHSPDPRMFNVGSIDKIRSECPDLTWVNWNGDFHPEDLLSSPNVAMARLFDLQCVVCAHDSLRRTYADAGVSWMYWQIGYEESLAEPDGSTPKHDVVFLANGYSHKRYSLGRMLRSLPCDVGIYGSWGGGIQPNGSNLYNFDEGRKLYRHAKLSVGDDQWGASGFVSNRLFQAMSAGGAMYMQKRVPDLEKHLGLVDGVHYVLWDDNNDLMDKIRYWLDPSKDAERATIADAGMRCMQEHHSFDARVQELVEVIL
jgi:glycosyltransferase involved in cell wall biosynthesis